VTGAALLVTALPRRLELILGRALGRGLRLCARRHRSVAEENLRRCLDGLDDAQRDGLLRRNFEHFGILCFEILHMFSPVPGHFRSYARRIAVLTGLENWEKANAKGKGVLFVGNHVGNWEIIAAQAGMRGVDSTIVTRNLTPGWLHAAINRARKSVGVQAALPPRILPTVLKALKRGGSVVFVMDQYAPPDSGGIPARFFGYKVDTQSVLAVLARKTGAALVPGSSRRDENGIIHVFMEPELELGADGQDISKATQLLSDRTESYIRANPEQWTWGHRRFKHVDWSDRTLTP
jgi:KDO2-lipid IV(A) lauroyltransferase